jgi:hypothetical protein
MPASPIKIIRHLPSKIDVADDPDPSLPIQIVVNLRPPEFMGVAFVMLYGGSEEIVARAADRGAVDQFLDETGLRRHPRLRWVRITGPDGVTEELQ